MFGKYYVVGVLVAVGGAASDLRAGDSAPASDTVKKAISRSLPLLEKGAAGSADQRKCFTCHNQALPVLALVEARNRGFTINKDNLERQLQHTEAHLKRGRKNYLEGRGQGGKVITAGYALWALEAGGRTPEETTAAVTGFLLEYQQQSNHWSHPGNRPPSSGSDFTTTYVALRGLAAFGTEDQQSKIVARTKAVRQWLLAEQPGDTEDRVFRLRALAIVDAGKETIQQAVAELIDSQHNNGGWTQTSDMTNSDAYATGTVLVALLRAGDLSTDHPAVRRGLQYLIDAQLEDGSWHTVSRAKPFQKYFETGFPHGKDQFISISASSWATLALLLTLPESPPGRGSR
jgi:N-acyl-D-amino-acid deacylase